jgi:hypothetical protein
MPGRQGWLESFLNPNSAAVERRHAERRPVDQFAAYRWSGSELKQEAVRDISSTGLYILTEERWQPGTMVFLTLQREGPLETSSERRIDVHAKVTRCGEDGVGLAFVLQDDPDSRQWESLRETLIEQAKPKDMLSLVRMAGAVAFLSRICPGGAEEIGQLLNGRLSNHKLAHAIAIALQAENLLSFEPMADELQAEPEMVVRILEDGACTDENWLRDFWGGLLATSCTSDGKDESTRGLVELFSQLTTYPVRILTVVCTRATKVVGGSGSISAKPLACKKEELKVTTESRGVQIDRDIERLNDLGLIEKSGPDSPTLLGSDEILLTPSILALQLFARCNGYRGLLQDAYIAE